MGAVLTGRTLAIMQPTYLPYLGYFVLMKAVDCFYFLDDVQFARDTWQQRNRLLSPLGAPSPEQRLSLPVIKAPLQTKLCDIVLDRQKDFATTHLSAIKQAYDGSEHFTKAYEFIGDHLSDPAHTSLSGLTIAIIKNAAQMMKIAPEMRATSTLGIEAARSQRLVKLCANAKATDYLSPIGAKDYLEEDGVLQQAVTIHYQSFTPDPYPQNRPDFIPYLGFLDAVMFMGFEATGEWVASRVAANFPTL